MRLIFTFNEIEGDGHMLVTTESTMSSGVIHWTQQLYVPQLLIMWKKTYVQN